MTYSGFDFGILRTYATLSSPSGLTRRSIPIEIRLVAYYVYIMASAPRCTLYIGVTNDIVRRAHEHREGVVPGFTKRYGVKRLVHFEALDDATSAISREKLLKRWNRAWKIALIERTNPQWDDLFDSIAN